MSLSEENTEREFILEERKNLGISDTADLSIRMKERNPLDEEDIFGIE